MPEGMEILLIRSKTDQEGEEHVCALPYGNERLCPVTALLSWKEKSGLSSEPIFVPMTKTGKLREHSLHSKNVSSVIRKLAIERQFPNVQAYSINKVQKE